MSKSSPDLKSAIQSLKISKPFDLRKQGHVELRPPQAEPAPIEKPQPELPRPKPAQIEVPRAEPSQVEPPRIELPRLSGFFRLSHSIFGEPVVRKLSGDSFRLYLWMSCQAWRFPDSDGTLRASISYIELGTGISHATISRSLGQLKTEGLVELIQTDFKRGNLWRVSKGALHDPSDSKPRKQGAQEEAPGSESSQTEATPSSNRVGSPLNSSEQLTRSEGQPRTPKTSQKSKTSLSTAIRAAVLQSYFDHLKPARKQESELRAYWTLRAEYSEAQIAEALSRLLERGLPESGAPCHSPMAYLSLAMANVSKLIEAEQEKQKETIRSAEREAQRIQDQAEMDKQACEDTDKALSAFHRVFPTSEQQQDVISRFAKEFPFLDPQGPVVRNLAIGRWWQQEARTLEAR